MSFLNHFQDSICSEDIYHSSEIIGKERKPGFSGYLQLSFRQQVSGTVPSLNSPVWMFHYGISLSQMLQIGVEPQDHPFIPIHTHPKQNTLNFYHFFWKEASVDAYKRDPLLGEVHANPA